jgi:hypothetical protein
MEAEHAQSTYHPRPHHRGTLPYRPNPRGHDRSWRACCNSSPGGYRPGHAQCPGHGRIPRVTSRGTVLSSGTGLSSSATLSSGAVRFNSSDRAARCRETARRQRAVFPSAGSSAADFLGTGFPATGFPRTGGRSAGFFRAGFLSTGDRPPSDAFPAGAACRSGLRAPHAQLKIVSFPQVPSVSVANGESSARYRYLPSPFFPGRSVRSDDLLTRCRESGFENTENRVSAILRVQYSCGDC